jgi:hypothetical protein
MEAEVLEDGLEEVLKAVLEEGFGELLAARLVPVLAAVFISPLVAAGFADEFSEALKLTKARVKYVKQFII